MAQRTWGTEPVSRSEASGRENRHDVDRRVLERMKWLAGDWERLDWFVRLSRLDLEKASPADIACLEEEWITLQRVWYRHGNPPRPTQGQLASLQTAVLRHLKELADGGATFFEDLHYSRRVIYPRLLQATISGIPFKAADFSGNPSFEFDRQVWDSPPEGEKTLLFLFAHLLGHGDINGVVRRCPHGDKDCQGIFVQSRRNQAFCSRSCQSRAIAQAQRDKAATKAKSKAKSKMTTKKPQRVSAKGEGHGKKTRKR